MAISARRRGILAILGAALLWSSGGIGIKFVNDPPLVVAFYRSLFAAVALFLLFRPRIGRITPAFAVAIGSYAICLTTFVVATKWTTAANAIFLQCSGVIWVLLLSPIVLKEPMRIKDALAVGVALCGMVLFFVGELDTRNQLGNAMAVVSSLFFATLIMSLRRERGSSARAAVTYGNILLALVLLPFVTGGLRLSAVSLLVLIGLGVFQIAVAYALFVKGLESVTATEAALIGMLEPIANPTWVFLFLGERPRGTALLGGAIVLAAVAWRTLTADSAQGPVH